LLPLPFQSWPEKKLSPLNRNPLKKWNQLRPLNKPKRKLLNRQRLQRLPKLPKLPRQVKQLKPKPQRPVVPQEEDEEFNDL
jgi:hypothetical protein